MFFSFSGVAKGKQPRSIDDTLNPLSDVTVVRGRVKSESKPETFNQLWTSEEQRRLEQLLVEFPPERVEARRYRKIADKLGTKTLTQVNNYALNLALAFFIISFYPFRENLKHFA